LIRSLSTLAPAPAGSHESSCARIPASLIGHGAAYVHRDATSEQMVPLPVVGHWLKKGWGAYFKASKRKRFPRLPGM